MSGGEASQAVTDLAGAVVGGGAQLCDVAASQDESLVQFYGEVLAFSFFTRTVDQGMLKVPWTLLGARRYISELSGESSVGAPYFNSCGKIQSKDWLNQNISTSTVTVPLNGRRVRVASSAFVAVASACSACLAGSSCPTQKLMNHQCDVQRRHLDRDIALWYQAYEPTMYNPVMQAAFRGVVHRLGTGPWGAGVWFGDSQQYFLTVWLATTLLSSKPKLDYYLYDHFCENPGNQCFLLSSGDCAACLKASGTSPPVLPSRCGVRSVHDMVAHFRGLPAKALYEALSSVGSPPDQVFDLLLPAPAAGGREHAHAELLLG
jgi:hypothetical protein